MEVSLLANSNLIFNSNCYGVLSEKAAIVIDPGKYTPETADFLNRNKDKERLILLTHCHFDHIGGAKQLSEKTGVKIAIGKTEAKYLNLNEYNLGSIFHREVDSIYPAFTFDDEEEYILGDLTIKTMLTPGHTIGSVCYLIDGVLFSGDTLFFKNVGRTDLAGGDSEKLMNSLMKLCFLPDDTVVYPGHANMTTIGHEKQYNPYMR